MSERTRQHKKERIIERNAHSPMLYEAAFGRFTHSPDIHTILDVAAGDSRYAVAREHKGQRVLRVDNDYARAAPHGDNWLPGDARELPLADGSVDMTLNSFMLMHLDPDSQAKAIKEMLRVTKPYNPNTESAVGTVGLYPVYKPERLINALTEAGFGDRFGLALDADAFEELPISERGLEYGTMWFPNWQDMDESDKDSMIATVVESGALNRRRNLMDMGRQVLMRARGDSRVDAR